MIYIWEYNVRSQCCMIPISTFMKSDACIISSTFSVIEKFIQHNNKRSDFLLKSHQPLLSFVFCGSLLLPCSLLFHHRNPFLQHVICFLQLSNLTSSSWHCLQSFCCPYFAVAEERATRAAGNSLPVWTVVAWCCTPTAPIPQISVWLAGIPRLEYNFRTTFIGPLARQSRGFRYGRWCKFWCWHRCSLRTATEFREPRISYRWFSRYTLFRSFAGFVFRVTLTRPVAHIYFN